MCFVLLSEKMSDHEETMKSVRNLEASLQNYWGNINEIVPKDKDILAEAQIYVDKQVKLIFSGLRPVPISYEDGDQSPLSGSGDKGTFLRYAWDCGMDYHPYNPQFVYLSDWLKTIYAGDYEGFLKIIKNKTVSQIKKMIARRESLLNISAIFHVIQGARVFKDEFAKERTLGHAKETLSLNVKNDHMKILIKLISLGADVNVHDVAGYTPLHHCVTRFGNELTFKMAEQLIRAGAKVNAKNRFGETPLAIVTLTTHFDAVKLLLDHGADPFMKDNDGCFPDETTKLNPKMQKLFGESYKKNTKEQLKNRESQSKCNVCHRKTETVKKCSGCYLVWYCNSKCQQLDWGNHKEHCSKTKSLYKIGKHMNRYVSTYGGIEGATVSAPPSKNRNLTKKHFIVKVQVPLPLNTLRDEENELMIYNKDRSFNVELSKVENPDLFSQLVKKITAEGYYGLKGYFHVILGPGDNEANQFRINPDNIFVEPW